MFVLSLDYQFVLVYLIVGISYPFDHHHNQLSCRTFLSYFSLFNYKYQICVLIIIHLSPADLVRSANFFWPDLPDQWSGYWSDCLIFLEVLSFTNVAKLVDFDAIFYFKCPHACVKRFKYSRHENILVVFSDIIL